MVSKTGKLGLTRLVWGHGSLPTKHARPPAHQVPYRLLAVGQTIPAMLGEIAVEIAPLRSHLSRLLNVVETDTVRSGT